MADFIFQSFFDNFDPNSIRRQRLQEIELINHLLRKLTSIYVDTNERRKFPMLNNNYELIKILTIIIAYSNMLQFQVELLNICL